MDSLIFQEKNDDDKKKIYKRPKIHMVSF